MNIGGSKGARVPRASLGVQILSISCSFKGKFGKIVCLRPPGELAPPPWGNPGFATDEYIVIYQLECLTTVYENCDYRSGTVNSNTVNSKFHLIRSFFEIFARFLLFHV